ncbi:MAG: MGH1-like glycoside hydrolase domain-containing protein [Limisphaerales bacterium]
MANDKKVPAELRRLDEDARREKNWKRWGPYLAERQWGTVREDYSPDGECWDYFTHEQARSRAYRWGEDGLLGFTDRECRLCFALALWNGRDPILKERLFGLTGPQGNHGEDVKECYFHLDSTPTHSYVKMLYKFPQDEFPYAQLVDENQRRTRNDPEFELEDTGIFDGNRYFDVFAEYAKAGPDDLLIRITVANRGPEVASLHLLPTLWFRNTWSWGCTHEGCTVKPRISVTAKGALTANHPTLGEFQLVAAPGPDGQPPAFLFTENETNVARLFGAEAVGPFVKDAFHDYVIAQRQDAVNSKAVGTKAAAYYRLEVPAGSERVISLRLSAGAAPARPSGVDFDRIFADRIREADEFYAARMPASASDVERRVLRQAYAGLLSSKQFYHYVVKDWLDGDPGQPPPPPVRQQGRNHTWRHLFNRDVISVPDKWEYPWYAAWDLGFHLVAFARVDPGFAKEQLVLFLREWYMHPNGQLPAYEFEFSDVNPPVQAWAAWRVYKITGAKDARDCLFLSRVFQKLLLNFTWWVNRKDAAGNNLFSGGFLGLDNIGVFDRSKPLPTGGYLEQADGTAWMAFYCATMLSIALKLAESLPAYEDMASKFFEHFVAIADAMNCFGGTGLWDEEDGFYYDRLHLDGRQIPLRVRSMVGIIPLFAVEIIETEVTRKLPAFTKRMRWFLENRQDLARHISYMEKLGKDGDGRRLLAIPSRDRLERVLRYVLDEDEFLSPYGIRSLSKVHQARPYVFRADGQEYRVEYVPGESNTPLFGGNSNWRGPVWFPLNYLLIEALERYHHFYGDSLRVECPTGSGRLMNLQEVAREIATRLCRLFLPDAKGRRPCHGDDPRFASDPHWRDLLLFHEYFHGETGRGLGASHQTGWTALVARCLEDLARLRKG